MPKYTFANGKVHVEEGKFASLLTEKQQFTDSVVFLILNERKTEENAESAIGGKNKNVRKDH